MTWRRLTAIATGILALVLACATGASAQARPDPRCDEGTLPGGARSLICVPTAGWNGEAVVYAHGYVPDLGQPPDFAHLELADGTYLPDLLMNLGFAFATTSYRTNGLAILTGVEDVAELTADLHTALPSTRRTWLAAVSEGALVATLAAEQHPSLFAGAYATCGPIGDFRFQINYLGDFRVLFDYFFPGVIPGSPIAIPPDVIATWPAIEARIVQLLEANRSRAVQLLRTTKAPYEPADFATVVNTTLGLLRYNIYGTNDATAKLGGNPFDNRLRWYWGSGHDLLLNARVRRFRASATALASLRSYNPTGDLTIPLVSLHTTGDEIVPAAHELIYASKVHATERGRFLPLPVFRYGHCNFTATEVLVGFALLRLQP